MTSIDSTAQRRPVSPGICRLLLTGLIGLTGLASSGTALAIDLGDASVLSRQGQRLKLAIPFGSAPGERVPALRFSVLASQALDGSDGAPDASRFTVSKPERRNVVFLTSEKPVMVERLRLVVSVAGAEPSSASYDLRIPPPRPAISLTPARAQ